MSDYTKIPLGQSLNQIASKRAAQAIQNTGRRLPCSVVSVVQSGIVTVRFEVDSGVLTLPQVTVPMAGPEYVRFPIQPGCRGFVTTADARLHQMSGLGTGQPDLTQPGNLTALVFVPFGSKAWYQLQPGAELYTVIYGENGVLIQDRPTSDMVTDPVDFVRFNSAGITLQTGGTTVNVDRATGDTTIIHGASEFLLSNTVINMLRNGVGYSSFVSDSFVGMVTPGANVLVGATSVDINCTPGQFRVNGTAMNVP